MSFDVAKRSLLSKLAAGIDFSPKGSIDAPIVHLVDFVNDLPDFVTTSSCSGRISVFRDEKSTKGIQWILVVHGAITTEQLRNAVIGQDFGTAGKHLVVMKCEGFILHVRCRNLECGRRLHQIAMGCGFRESGLSVGQKMRVQLAIRTTAYGLELPIATGNHLLLDDVALEIIVSEANRRLRCNFARTDRMLSAMKREYLWPSVVVRNLPDHQIQRWGHSSAAFNDCGHVIVGGYGVEVDVSASGAPSSDRQHSTRKLSNVCYEKADASSKLFNLKEADNVVNDYFMHAAVSEFKFAGLPFLAVSGGRDSPQKALKILRIYKMRDNENHLNSTSNGSNVDMECMSHTESGDIPLPRWGHTLTALGSDSNHFLLFGGRDEKQAFGDAYLLTLCHQHVGSQSSQIDAIILHFIWCKIPSQDALSAAVSTVPSSRFFHAACYYSMTDHETHKIEGSFLDVCPYATVLIHGGLLSLEDPVTCGHCYVLNVRTGTWTTLLNITSGNSNKNIEGTTESCDQSTEAFTESPDTHSDSIPPVKRDNASSDTTSVTEVEVGVHNTRVGTFFRRFGHTITDVGYKTLIVAGGVAFEGAAAAVDGDDDGDGAGEQRGLNNDNLYEGVCVIDIQSNDDATLCGSTREMNVLTNSTDNIQDNKVYLQGLEIESEQKANLLPCSDCRCHHTAVYKKDIKALHLLGGGALCMSFGAHYCSSVVLQISSTSQTLNSSEDGLYSNEERSRLSDTPYTADIDTASTANIDPPTVVLLVPNSRVKLVKTFLENQPICWFDKKRRITMSEVAVEDIVYLDMKDIDICENDFIAYDKKIRLDKVKEKKGKCNDVSKEAVKLLTGVDLDEALERKTEEKEVDKEKEVQNEKEKEKGSVSSTEYMAVPIVSSLANILLSGSKGLTTANQIDLCLCLGYTYFDLNSTLKNNFSIKLGYQNVKVSKRLCASGYRKADEYLEGVVRDLGLDSTASLNYPRKYEIVGNVLMIPEDALVGPVWEVILPEPCSDTATRSLLDAAIGERMLLLLLHQSHIILCNHYAFDSNLSLTANVYVDHLFVRKIL